MTRILAIDPGNTMSAFVLIDSDLRPAWFDKCPNDDLLERLGDLVSPEYEGATRAAIEMVSAYGMPVGAEVFETCVWIGRFQQRLDQLVPVEFVKRGPIKVHHCNSSRAKDSNITQALVDRFAAGQRNKGKGTIAEPGWFYGFHTDLWQAYALAVYVADQEAGWTP